jgi:hypothetical protein
MFWASCLFLLTSGGVCRLKKLILYSPVKQETLLYLALAFVSRAHSCTYVWKCIEDRHLDWRQESYINSRCNRSYPIEGLDRFVGLQEFKAPRIPGHFAHKVGKVFSLKHQYLSPQGDLTCNRIILNYFYFIVYKQNYRLLFKQLCSLMKYKFCTCPFPYDTIFYKSDKLLSINFDRKIIIPSFIPYFVSNYFVFSNIY